MVITVEAVCRNCNTNEPVNISVADWTGVKENLTITPGWRCSKCNCRAAYWYVKRNVEFETLEKTERQAIDEEQGYQQPFACTEDDGFPIPPDFDGTVVNPITRVAL